MFCITNQFIYICLFAKQWLIVEGSGFNFQADILKCFRCLEPLTLKPEKLICTSGHSKASKGFPFAKSDT